MPSTKTISFVKILENKENKRTVFVYAAPILLGKTLCAFCDNFNVTFEITDHSDYTIHEKPTPVSDSFLSIRCISRPGG